MVIPCLNEANSLGICVDKAIAAFAAGELRGEVVVADNGSTDGSIEIAEAHGARVVRVPQRGYGAALQAGIGASRGRYVVMGDADDSYDFTEVPQFVRKLREGYDLVMGNRFRGGIKPGAMPWLHKYFGNPGLTASAQLIFPRRNRGQLLRDARIFAGNVRLAGRAQHGNGIRSRTDHQGLATGRAHQ